MKHRILKNKIVLTFIVLILTVFVLAGCSFLYDYRTGEGYFEVEYFECYSYGKTVVICNLTPKGLELEEIIVPVEINEMDVSRFGWTQFDNPSVEHNFDKGAAKKYFFTTDINIKTSDAILNVEKVILISTRFSLNLDMILARKYVPSQKIEAIQQTTAAQLFPANTSYYYNYEGAGNYGYYWIDDINEGDVIMTIPLEPRRYGYIFDGWFAEAECITPWDFETQKTADKDFELYAKWIDDE
ncbi:MAG: InlB B-repeat-containing protein [Christensenellaceae bacterium]|jgi:uncharacterized repeat protein (TIGR02543 family)|nr:InlB B-repeat-containing protein [Christensenellaceae bacterium]